MEMKGFMSQRTTVPRNGVTGLPPPTDGAAAGPTDLMERYEAILGKPRLSWIEHHRVIRRLGSGGQGVVYLCARVGMKNVTPGTPDGVSGDRALAVTSGLGASQGCSERIT
jgi:hypothetical protein